MVIGSGGVRKMPSQLIVNVPVSMQDVVESAAVRLGGLFTDIQFEVVGSTIHADAADDFDRDELKKNILNTVYREAVFQRTIGIREALFR